MAGTVVRDATGPDLATGLTLTGAGSDTGDAVDMQYPCHFTVALTTGTVTGTTPTLDVTIQAADDSAFTDDVVDLAAFPQIGDEDDTEKFLKLFTNKRYVRASITKGGTSPVYTGTTLKVVPFFDRHTVTTSA